MEPAAGVVRNSEISSAGWAERSSSSSLSTPSMPWRAPYTVPMACTSRAASTMPRSVLLMTGLGPPLWATTRLRALGMRETLESKAEESNGVDSTEGARSSGAEGGGWRSKGAPGWGAGRHTLQAPLCSRGSRRRPARQVGLDVSWRQQADCSPISALPQRAAPRAVRLVCVAAPDGWLRKVLGAGTCWRLFSVRSPAGSPLALAGQRVLPAGRKAV